MKKYEEVIKEVKKALSEKRFYHSQCVEERCVEFAKIYGADVKKARLIGIAHDIAKELPDEEKIKIMKENNLQITEIEKEHPSLLAKSIFDIVY